MTRLVTLKEADCHCLYQLFHQFRTSITWTIVVGHFVSLSSAERDAVNNSLHVLLCVFEEFCPKMKCDYRKTYFIIDEIIDNTFLRSIRLSFHCRYEIITVRCGQSGYQENRQLCFLERNHPSTINHYVNRANTAETVGSTGVAAQTQAIKIFHRFIIELPGEFWHPCRLFSLLMENEQSCGCFSCLKANNYHHESLRVCISALENIRSGSYFGFLLVFAWICSNLNLRNSLFVDCLQWCHLGSVALWVIWAPVCEKQSKIDITIFFNSTLSSSFSKCNVNDLVGPRDGLNAEHQFHLVVHCMICMCVNYTIFCLLHILSSSPQDMWTHLNV